MNSFDDDEREAEAQRQQRIRAAERAVLAAAEGYEVAMAAILSDPCGRTVNMGTDGFLNLLAAVRDLREARKGTP